LTTTDEIYEKLQELRLKFEHELKMADNLITENILKIGQKLDEIINQYNNVRTKISIDGD
jgi:sulfatase maturation enzyme AslB (radical SAM superfamily)